MIRLAKSYLDRKRHYYLGFSGGIDSLSAAKFLKEGGWNFTLFHVVHFPTEHSEAIRAGVAVSAKELDLPVKYAHPYRDVHPDVLIPTESNAHALRNRAITLCNSPVILCNHLNDMGETYFMNMCAGHTDWIPLVYSNGNKLRPFLETRRKDFENYAERKGLMHLVVPDTMSNERARLRTEVFPVIGQDFASLCKRLYIDTGRVYEGASHLRRKGKE